MEISDWTGNTTGLVVQFKIYIFELEISDSSNFKISLHGRYNLDCH
jgi:hypothetical protein